MKSRGFAVQAGDNVGLLIRGLKRDEVQRGQVRYYFITLQSGHFLQLIITARTPKFRHNQLVIVLQSHDEIAMRPIC